MKKYIFFIFLYVIGCSSLCAQKISSHTIKYMVTFEQEVKKYTVWVVPGYDVPNAYNVNEHEKGATAQVTLEMPNSARITSVEDIVGIWEKKPFRFENNDILKSLSIDLHDKTYYVIGKAPVETNYGEFKKGVPVALFSFAVEGEINTKSIRVIGLDHEFVQIADSKLSLNMASSFYSRSGQLRSPNAIPSEQYTGEVKENNLYLFSEDLGQDVESSGIYAFPNPFQSQIKIRFFFPGGSSKSTLTLTDLRGRVVHASDLTLSKGLNEQLLDLRHLPDGSYVIKVVAADWSLSRSLVKNK